MASRFFEDASGFFEDALLFPGFLGTPFFRTPPGFFGDASRAFWGRLPGPDFLDVFTFLDLVGSGFRDRKFSVNSCNSVDPQVLLVSAPCVVHSHSHSSISTLVQVFSHYFIREASLLIHFMASQYEFRP